MTIRLSSITKKFGDHLVVNNVSLTIKDGELFVLLGSSGSGKSTILRIIAGLLAAEAGTIELQGVDVTTVPPQKRGTGFVFQNYAIFKHMSVAENVEFGLKIRGMNAAQRRARRDELLDMVGLIGFATRMPNQLSGGQRQRVALARALAYKPSVLLLDEPFGALDVRMRTQLRRTLKTIQRELKITSVLVTHDQEEAFELGDRIAVLERGRLVEVGTAEDLYHRPRSEFVAAFIGGGNVLIGRAEEGKIRLGAATLPFPPGTPTHEEGAPVRLLFRPESVRYREEPFAEDEGFVLGEGKIVERAFAGPSERLRFELEALRGVRSLAPTFNYGQRFAVVEASTPSFHASQYTAPEIGEKRWVALNHYHVLQPSAIKAVACIGQTDAYKAAIAVGTQIMQASHGTLAVLGVAGPEESIEAQKKRIDEIVAEHPLRPRIEARARSGDIGEEIVFDIQERQYDVVIMGRNFGDEEQEKKLASFIRRVLVYARVPVLLATDHQKPIERLLICTAAGEPGKGDVVFGARLARHMKTHTTVFHALRSNASAEEKQRVERHLEQAGHLLNSLNISNEVKVATEGPLKSILSEAEKGNHDLVVIGASDFEGARQRPSQDLLYQLIVNCPKSVLIVPMRS